jgi:hypothetical protein
MASARIAGPRYVCGLLHAPADWLPGWTGVFGARLLQRWARRVISAGIGCDAALQAQAVAEPPALGPAAPPAARPGGTPRR